MKQRPAIVRTKTKAHGGITAREKQLMDEHAELWIARAMRTTPIEPDKIIAAIEGLYAAAKLKKPRVVIVPSPLIMAFVYGASSAILYNCKRPQETATAAATDAATYDATRAATYDATYAATYAATDAATAAATAAATYDATAAATDAATRAATYAATDAATADATYDATYAATDAATYAATDAATAAATRAATRAATYDATYDATAAATDAATRDATYAATDAATADATDDATYDATYDATDAATYAATYDATDAATYAATDAATACQDLAGLFGLECAKRWYKNCQGGNMWAGYECYLTSCRDILGLELREHAAYSHWEQAAIHGGFRIMHEDFCLVSEFPMILLKDEENRPHCETGPSHRWRDGWSLYHWHGTRVPAEWIENKSSLSAKIALGQSNLELRRAACEILGWSKILGDLNARTIDRDNDPEIGELVEVNLPDLDRPAKFLRVRCGTGREFAIGIPPYIIKALDAQAWMVGLEPQDFNRPEIRT